MASVTCRYRVKDGCATYRNGMVVNKHAMPETVIQNGYGCYHLAARSLGISV